MKKYVLIILIVIISVIFCSCKEIEENNILNELIENDSIVVLPAEEKEEISSAPISIWYRNGRVEKEVESFINVNRDITVDEKSFIGEGYSQYNENVVLELLAGSGPDIITDINFVGQVYELMKHDIFYDLTRYMNEDDEFNIDDYVKPVLDIGKYQGKQVFLPIEFNVPFLATTGEALEKENLELDDYLSWEKIEELGKIYNGENNKRYFSSSRIWPLYCLFNGKLIDYDMGKSYFENSDFLELSEKNSTYYKTIPTELFKENIDYDYFLNLVDEELVLFNYGYLSRTMISKTLEQGYRYHIYPIQSTKGGDRIRCYFETFIAINKNAKNKKDCFEYIKYIMGDMAQLKYCRELPVNKKAFLNYITYTEKKYNGEDIGNFADSIKRIYNNIEGGFMYDDFYIIANGVFWNSPSEYSEDDLLKRADYYISKAFHEGSKEVFEIFFDTD